MFARAFSSALWGIAAKLVQVEVDVRPGLPGFTIVGLPDAAVKESRDRVTAALKNAELALPPRRITVNLAPADLRKEGPTYDLPIALALLAATEQLAPAALDDHLIFGELSLDGRVCPVRGALSFAAAAKPHGFLRILLPAENAAEAGVLADSALFPARTLLEALEHLSGRQRLEAFSLDWTSAFQRANTYTVDFSEVRSQFHAKRALEVAAAGGHNVLLIGPPGSGKTMLTQRLPTILPDLTLTEALETTQLYSLNGLLPAHSTLVLQRPFRAPHHTVSDIALIGGGTFPRPGEVSLAHNGVLFLDELPEFSKHALEVLRQPLEERQVTISRTAAAVTYPARFMLIAAMNPCPCGYYTDPHKECSCTFPQIHKYLSKISGPLLDRFDLHLEVPAVKYQELASTTDPESSAQIRERVMSGRARQQERYAAHPGVLVNAHLTPRLIRQFCRLDADSQQLLRTALDRLGLSARGDYSILKVSRTIADLAASEAIQAEHVAEAIQYRALDRRFFGRAPALR